LDVNNTNLLIETTKQEPKYSLNEIDNMGSKLEEANNASKKPAKKPTTAKRKKAVKPSAKGKDSLNNSGLDEHENEEENEPSNVENTDYDHDLDGNRAIKKLSTMYNNVTTAQTLAYNNSHQSYVNSSNLNFYGQNPYAQQPQQHQQQMYPWMKDGTINGGSRQHTLPITNSGNMIMSQIGINVSPQNGNRYFGGVNSGGKGPMNIMMDSSNVSSSNLANTTILSSGSVGSSTSPSTSSSLTNLQNDSIVTTTPTTGKLSKHTYYYKYTLYHIITDFSEFS
jgi:hypothetical protein